MYHALLRGLRPPSSNGRDCTCTPGPSPDHAPGPMLRPTLRLSPALSPGTHLGIALAAALWPYCETFVALPGASLPVSLDCPKRLNLRTTARSTCSNTPTSDKHLHGDKLYRGIIVLRRTLRCSLPSTGCAAPMSLKVMRQPCHNADMTLPPSQQQSTASWSWPYVPAEGDMGWP